MQLSRDTFQRYVHVFSTCQGRCEQPGEGSMDPSKQSRVALQAAPTCVTVTGDQWLCLVTHRWQ
jgi:hypothetical protein